MRRPPWAHTGLHGAASMVAQRQQRRHGVVNCTKDVVGFSNALRSQCLLLNRTGEMPQG